MSLYSGYNANFDYGNGYTPAANVAIANNNANYTANQNYVRDYGQSVINQANANWAATNPASGYGQVGGYPSFGEPSGGGSVFDTGAAPYDDYGQPGGAVGGYDNPISWRGLNDEQQNYIQAHKSAYGYTPAAGFFDPGGGWDQTYGTPATPQAQINQDFNQLPGGGGGAPTPMYGNLNPEQANYVKEHIAAYGRPPDADFFSPGGGWDQTYGGYMTGDEAAGLGLGPAGSTITPQQQIDNRFGSFAGGSDALQSGLNNYVPATGNNQVDWNQYFNDVTRGGGTGGQSLNPEQMNYVQEHINAYGKPPEAGFFAPGGGWDQNYGAVRSVNTNSTAQGVINQDFSRLPGGGMAPAGSMYGNLNPEQENYVKEHIAAYGRPPEANFFEPGGGWDKTYGPGSRNSIASTLTTSGGDPSYLGAGGPNNSYNPFGTINSGVVGNYDAFQGYQPAPSFDDRFGNIPGQPYGQGYFDNTFGSVNAQPQAYNPTYGGSYPGPMASDFQNSPARGASIDDLTNLLREIDNSGESGRYLNQPYWGGSNIDQGFVNATPGG